jgi:hypothetical protein
MLEDDESLIHIVPIGIRRCPTCQGVLAAFAFPQDEEALPDLREISKDLGAPIFAFRDRDASRAHVYICWETSEEVFVTPKEFGDLVRRYAENHVCASWN